MDEPDDVDPQALILSSLEMMPLISPPRRRIVLEAAGIYLVHDGLFPPFSSDRFAVSLAAEATGGLSASPPQDEIKKGDDQQEGQLPASDTGWSNRWMVISRILIYKSHCRLLLAETMEATIPDDLRESIPVTFRSGKTRRDDLQRLFILVTAKVGTITAPLAI